MGEKSFSIKEVISSGWGIMKKNFWFFVIFMIVAAILQGIDPSARKMPIGDPATSIFVIIGLLLSTLVTLASAKISLDAANNKKLSLDSLKGTTTHYLSFLVLSILISLIVMAGLVLLVVPGVIWAIQFSMAPYLVIDKQMNPIDAMKESSRITKGKKWQLFLFGLTLIGMNLLGALALGIGLFATIPTSMVADALIYKKLKG